MDELGRHMDPRNERSTSTGGNAHEQAASPSPSTARASSSPAASDKLSYKFQRLREKLRQAIASGELHGKLPGERQLARKFRVNAKTLSKALTDLAAEGLLERSIGRGTFVQGRSDATASSGAHAHADRCLIICNSAQLDSPVVRLLAQANPGAQVVHDTTALRPSFLSQFRAVVDFAPDTPAHFLRDLVVRNAAVVLVGREPQTYSMNAVLMDRLLGAAQLARELMLAGHRRFLAVERHGSTAISDAVRKTAPRCGPDATVDVAYPDEAGVAVEQGAATALICDSAEAAGEVVESMRKIGVDVPGRASVAAVGCGEGEYPCTGYFVRAEQKVEAIQQVLRDGHARRPTTLWLTGTYFDAGTTGPTDAMRRATADLTYDAATATA